ncbi:SymE family type I addiction module toxin [Paraburkholderia azotifigens]|uniref:SymE family type I addiction module toxin n=1 Tax=Paraburkholderia azotifigens TaxID=2057004 RepID=A0A5C6VFR0_9BURK|nr:type I toxin-antitoxin system SymE family toxin [Paraburkholderia azotifigens]
MLPVTLPPADAECGTAVVVTRHQGYPWIKLSGRWLELAGFKAGQQVRIEVHHGRLVITHDCTTLQTINPARSWVYC